MKATVDLDIKDLASQIAKEVERAIKPLLSQNNPGNDLIYSVRGLAGYLNVSAQWVYQRIQLKEIPHIKVGKHVRFKKSDIDTWLDGLKIPSMNPPSSVPKSLHNPKKSKVTT